MTLWRKAKMIKVRVLKKNKNEIVEEKQILTLYDLERYISRVSSTDIRYNDYHIEKTPRTLEFFKRTYFAYFYVEFEDYISLVSLKHAQKRVKNYRKKTNSNKIFENTLLRIQIRLDKTFRKYRMTPTVIMPRLSNERYEKIKINIKDQENTHAFEFEFDKVLWTFKTISIKTTKPNLIKEVSKSIRYTTTPTKIYREKHKVIENENYIK